jgi:membrane associated rhomboid family serine protease
LPYAARRGPGGWEIRVPEPFYDAAAQVIDAYRSENPPTTDAAPHAPKTPVTERTYSGVWVSLMLVAVHLAVQAASDPAGILKKAGASAGAIASGELYRTATALTLHADVLHLAGNIVGIAVFATAVCHLTGAGVGWAMVLASGLLGNLANAWLVAPEHLSVGASTAVFGALGILSAVQFYRKRSAGDAGLRAWLPLAGGLALLAFLGSGVHTDLTAHLFGFVSGIGLGFFFAARIGQPPAQPVQRWLLGFSAAILIVSWLAALS